MAYRITQISVYKQNKMNPGQYQQMSHVRQCFDLIVACAYGRQSWIMLYFIDHPRSGMVFRLLSVCLSVCQTITFESLDVWSSFTSGISPGSIRVKFVGTICHRVKVKKVTKAKKQKSQEYLFPQCKTSIGKNWF